MQWPGALSNPKLEVKNIYPEKISHIFRKNTSYILGPILMKRKISNTSL